MRLIEALSVIGVLSISAAAAVTMTPTGGESWTYRSSAGARFAQDSPANTTVTCLSYIQRVGNSGGPAYLAAQNDCGLTADGIDIMLLGAGPAAAMRWFSRTPQKYLGEIGTDGMNLAVPLKVNNVPGISATINVTCNGSPGVLTFASGVLVGSTC